MKKKTYKATLWLPTEGRNKWSSIMSDSSTIYSKLAEAETIVSSSAKFRDGTQVVAGVKKSAEYNYKFYHVLNAAGQEYGGYPIDTSDHTDFEDYGYSFFLNDNEDVEYKLSVKEKKAKT